MKKLIIALAAALMTAGFVSAQDLATATESYNNGAAQLNEGNKVEALASFKEALNIKAYLNKFVRYSRELLSCDLFNFD